MKQLKLLDPIQCTKYDLLEKDEVVELHKEEERLRLKLQKENEALKLQLDLKEQLSIGLSEEYCKIKNKLFGKSSEKSKKSSKKKESNKKRVQLPSKKYPNIPVEEIHLFLDETLKCPSCDSEMSDSDLTEITEQLTVIPKKYLIEKIIKHKKTCNKCHSTILTPKSPAKIVPGSNYSDEMVLDVVNEKYCNLIPIERYTSIASRLKVDLPQNTLIGLTHHAANFFEKAVERIKNNEILSEKILY